MNLGYIAGFAAADPVHEMIAALQHDVGLLQSGVNALAGGQATAVDTGYWATDLTTLRTLEKQSLVLAGTADIIQARVTDIQQLAAAYTKAMNLVAQAVATLQKYGGNEPKTCHGNAVPSNWYTTATPAATHTTISSGGQVAGFFYGFGLTNQQIVTQAQNNWCDYHQLAREHMQGMQADLSELGGLATLAGKIMSTSGAGAGKATESNDYVAVLKARIQQLVDYPTKDASMISELATARDVLAFLQSEPALDKVPNLLANASTASEKAAAAIDAGDYSGANTGISNLASLATQVAGILSANPPGNHFDPGYQIGSNPPPTVVPSPGFSWTSTAHSLAQAYDSYHQLVGEAMADVASLKAGVAEAQSRSNVAKALAGYADTVAKLVVAGETALHAGNTATASTKLAAAQAVVAANFNALEMQGSSGTKKYSGFGVFGATDYQSPTITMTAADQAMQAAANAADQASRAVTQLQSDIEAAQGAQVSTPGPTPSATPSCPTGYVYDSSTGNCIAPHTTQTIQACADGSAPDPVTGLCATGTETVTETVNTPTDSVASLSTGAKIGIAAGGLALVGLVIVSTRRSSTPASATPVAGFRGLRYHHRRPRRRRA